MNNFSCLSEINPQDYESYNQRIFLTFDIDWAHDEVIKYTLDLIEASKIQATIFITHDTPLIDRMRSNNNLELGIHPNFNPLLDGTEIKKRTEREVMDEILEIVPNAKCLRSHSLTQSERLLDIFSEYGLSHISNTYIPFMENNILRPWKLWSDLIITPHFFQDNVELRLRNELSVNNSLGLKIYDFHPIHIFLNSNYYFANMASSANLSAASGSSLRVTKIN